MVKQIITLVPDKGAWEVVTPDDGVIASYKPLLKKVETFFLKEVDAETVMDILVPSIFGTAIAGALAITFLGGGLNTPSREVINSKSNLQEAQAILDKAEARASSPQGQFCSFLRSLHGKGVKCNF
jgi:hypothetical protein